MRMSTADDASGADLGAALKACRGAFVGVGVFSALINILYLTGSFYMLQIYDRVLPSRSVPTLVALSVLAAVLYAGQGALDFVRGRILLRISRSFDEHLNPRIFVIIARAPLITRTSVLGLQPMRDLDQVRAFLAGPGPSALLDLPWMPLYLAICFVFHPLIGIAALFGAIVLAVLTILTEVFTRKPMRAAAQCAANRVSIAETARRNAEVLTAMGMTQRIATIWSRINQNHLDTHERAADVASGIAGIAKVFRIALQSGVLGIGAYLVILGEASAGVIIASSILAARALAPVDQVIANWKGFVSARQSWKRLRELLAAVPAPQDRLSLPRPRASLAVENLSVTVPDKRLVVRDISFTLGAGTALGIIGPSASGKSSLARALVGAWTPAKGSVRLDGAALDQWSSAALGGHIGYLPQQIELLDGTIAQNIARFDPEADPATVIAAAEKAGMHDMIVRLPQGYETRIGEDGMALSGGQRQRIGLARALFDDPFLIVLDEPNSNLDAEGEQALTDAIAGVRARGGIVVVIAHRPSALAAIDQVLIMSAGEAKAFGPRDQVVRPMMRAVAANGAGHVGPGAA